MKPIVEARLNHPQLSISPCETSFNSFIERDCINQDLKKELLSANTLIVPDEGYGDLTDQEYFPGGTLDLYQYILDRKDESLSIGVCMDDEKYKELSLHADWVYLAEFVVKDLLAPVIVALLADYIIHIRGKRVEHTNVKSKLVLIDTKDEHRVEYIYEGPALEYKEVMMNAILDFGKAKHDKKRHKKKREKLHGS